jgi:hypothetical protein
MIRSLPIALVVAKLRYRFHQLVVYARFVF